MRKRCVLLLAGLIVLGAAAFLLTFHPSRPLYMRHRAVEIVSADGTVLAGTLSLPRWTRHPVAAVAMVHGSGRITRDQLIGDVRGLVRNGIGVLAYDKRGCGASGGVYPQGADGFENALRLLTEDAEAVFARLRSEEGVDPSRLGFFGASQASWIIPIAAERLEPKPRFHVILSGAAVSTGVENFYSQLTGDGIRAPRERDPLAIRAQVAAYAGSTGFDPAPALMALRVPTLWLLGDRDESVPTFASVRVLETIRQAGNNSHTVIVYPETDHGLRNVGTRRSAPIWEDMRAWLEDGGVLESGSRG
jgi:alpha-beta hydrolase superfamily lysophospholipase